MSRDPVLAQLEKPIESYCDLLAASPPLSPKAVHDLRVLTKQLRALLRLYQPFVEVENWQFADAQARSIARAFAGLRDRQVQVKTMTRLLRGKPHLIFQLQPIYDYLLNHEDQTPRDDAALGSQLHDLLVFWEKHLAQSGPHSWIPKGAELTFRKAHRRGKRACQSLADDDFHHWRRWLKYWLYQQEWMTVKDNSKLIGYRKQLTLLGTRLGQFQDCCVLEQTLKSRSDTIVDASACDYAIRILQKRKDELRQYGMTHFSELFDLKKKKLNHILGALVNE
jgi:CHAD domain-containing protein